MDQVSPFYDVPEIVKLLKFFKYRTMVVEGLIGAGKTTLLRAIERLFNKYGVKIKIYLEPVIPEFLEMVIKDSKKYAFAFQLQMLSERTKIYTRAEEKKKKGYFTAIDRSLQGDQTFEALHHHNGTIDDREDKIYNIIIDKNKYPKPDITVFLDVPPSECMPRIDSRGTEAEKSYTLEFLEKLEDMYRSKLDLTQCLVVDWTSSNVNNGEVKESSVIEILQRAMEFIRERDNDIDLDASR